MGRSRRRATWLPGRTGPSVSTCGPVPLQFSDSAVSWAFAGHTACSNSLINPPKIWLRCTLAAVRGAGGRRCQRPEADPRHPHPGGGGRRRRSPRCTRSDLSPAGHPADSTAPEYGPRYHRSPQTSARIPHPSEAPTQARSRLAHPEPTSPQVTALGHSAGTPGPRFHQPWCTHPPRQRPLTGISPGQGPFLQRGG